MLSLLACGGEPADETPDEPSSIVLNLVSGNQQMATVGSELAQPIVVRAVTGSGAPIADVTVTFHVLQGSGTLFAGTVVTDRQGNAFDYWTIGTHTADSQIVEARAFLPQQGLSTTQRFIALAHAGAPSSLIAVAGNGQTARAGDLLPQMPLVQLTDAFGNPVPDLALIVRPRAGAGAVSVAQVTTDAVGQAKVAWTLGPVSGTDTLVLAPTTAVAGLDSVYFIATATGNFWLELPPLPTGRSLSAAVELNGIIYVVGGADEFAGGPYAAVEAYDPAARSWSPRAPLPDARSGMGAVVVSGLLYVVGGTMPDIVAYHPQTDSWTPITSLPSPRLYPGVAVLDGRIYVAGGIGSDGELQTAVDRFNPATDSWSSAAQLPRKTAGLGLVVAGGKLYAIGGCCEQVGAEYDALLTVSVYDPAANSWSDIVPLPGRRRFMVTTVAEGKIFSIGGESARGMVASGTALDLAEGSWSPIADMPLILSGAAGVAFGGRSYVFGGVNNLTFSQDAVLVYVP